MGWQAGENGRLYVLGTHVLMLGVPMDNLPHAHYGASVLVAAGAPFQFCSGGQWRETRGVLVRPCEQQQLKTADERVLILNLDPDTAEYARVGMRLREQPVVELEAEEIAAIRAAMPERELPERPQALALLEHVVEVLAVRAPEPLRRDPRVDGVCRKLRALVLAGAEALPTPAQLAADAALSESRLQHLFKAELGLSIGQYVLWLRTGRAVLSLHAGSSLTEAAVLGGFADSAHFSRTFRRMFGLRPSFVLKNSSNVQVFIDPDSNNQEQGN